MFYFFTLFKKNTINIKMIILKKNIVNNYIKFSISTNIKYESNSVPLSLFQRIQVQSDLDEFHFRGRFNLGERHRLLFVVKNDIKCCYHHQSSKHTQIRTKFIYILMKLSSTTHICILTQTLCTLTCSQITIFFNSTKL